jgi:hypothetical protein
MSQLTSDFLTSTTLSSTVVAQVESVSSEDSEEALEDDVSSPNSQDNKSERSLLESPEEACSPEAL